MDEFKRKQDSIYTMLFYEGYTKGNGKETVKDGFFEGCFYK